MKDTNMKAKFNFLLISNFLLLFLLLSCNPAAEKTEPAKLNSYLIAEFRNGALPYVGYEGCEDTYIASGTSYNSINFGTCGYVAIGESGNIADGLYRGLIKFDISIIPGGVKVKKAFLTFEVFSSTGVVTISAHKKTNFWVPGPNCGTPGGTSWTLIPGGTPFDSNSAGSIVVNTAKYYSINLSTSMVQEWVSDSSKNFGMLLKAENESAANTISLYATDAPFITNRPKLTIYYTID